MHFLIEFSNIISVFVSLLLIGCSSFTSLQHPEVQAPLQFSGGVGISYTESYGPLTALNFRMGLIKRFDAGIKMDHSTYEIDARYQVLKEPFFLTTGFAKAGHDLSEGYARIYQPSITIGQTNWYAGLHLLFSDAAGTIKMQSNYFSYERGGLSAYKFHIGGFIKLGDGRLLVEINRLTFLTNNRSYYIPAIGVQMLY